MTKNHLIHLLELGHSVEMEYSILESSDSMVLVEKVNKAISLGWKPQGGVSNSSSMGHSWYIQAMIKETDENLTINQ